VPGGCNALCIFVLGPLVRGSEGSYEAGGVGVLNEAPSRASVRDASAHGVGGPGGPVTVSPLCMETVEHARVGVAELSVQYIVCGSAARWSGVGVGGRRPWSSTAPRAVRWVTPVVKPKTIQPRRLSSPNPAERRVFWSRRALGAPAVRCPGCAPVWRGVIHDTTTSKSSREGERAPGTGGRGARCSALPVVEFLRFHVC
jgi:hypothetical protein